MFWGLALSFLFLLCVVVAGVSCCRVVPLVVVLTLYLGFGPVILGLWPKFVLVTLGLVLWPVLLWLLSRR